jgi:hypothetical protein
MVSAHLREAEIQTFFRRIQASIDQVFGAHFQQGEVKCGGGIRTFAFGGSIPEFAFCDTAFGFRI